MRITPCRFVGGNRPHSACKWKNSVNEHMKLGSHMNSKLPGYFLDVSDNILGEAELPVTCTLIFKGDFRKCLMIISVGNK
jgi:hypothetical protein